MISTDNITMSCNKPLVLMILDGWGNNPDIEHNAIAQASTPVFDQLLTTYPHQQLITHGSAVGLPKEQMGNSEVGHMNLGAGRAVQQTLSRLDEAIANKEFANNPVLCRALDDTAHSDHAIHILGLLSSGGIHSHNSHIHALLQLAQSHNVKKVYVHAFLDGRDTPPRSATAAINELQELCEKLQTGSLATISGRYYAMDRDQRWERISPAYQAIVTGKSTYNDPDPLHALNAAYERGENDEFVQPTVINSVPIVDGDSIIFMNFRADRARQLTQALTAKEFTGFTPRRYINLAHCITLTEYAKNLDVSVAFPPQPLTNVLGEVIAQANLQQLRIAETEKYAHVTFFFNGGREQPFVGEQRILIPSPNVATYDQQPEMSAPQLTDQLCAVINSEQCPDVIIVNYANPDMVGHSGNLTATISAIETVDCCMGKVINSVQHQGGELLITADHGNAESLYDSDKQQPLTAHTTNYVPFIYVGSQATLDPNSLGCLADVAPTMLTLLNIPIPAEMTGQSLIEKNK